MKKSILKRFLVFSMCMSILSGFASANVSKAESIKGNWRLFFNPASNPGTWLKTTEKAFVPKSSTGTIYVTSITKGATVGVKVLNYSPECLFTKATNTKVYNIPTKYTQTLRARYTEYKNVITEAEGFIYI